MSQEVNPQQKMFIEKVHGTDMADVQVTPTDVQRMGPDGWAQYMCAKEFAPC